MIVSLENVAPASPSGQLRVMTYNVFDGPRDPAGVGEAIASAQPDILALQEVDEKGARFLASELGYRGVFFGQAKDLRNERRFINGKAILSRYPLSFSEHRVFLLDPEERARACERRGDWGELNEDRGVLLAEAVVGERRIEVLCVHLALGDARINAENLRQLHRFAWELRKEGHELAILGDFNTHLGIRKEKDLENYLERYGKSPGNIIQPEVREAAGKLVMDFPSVWENSSQRSVVLPGGRVLSPEEAERSLASFAPGSGDWLKMANAAEGNTHPAANKRYDNILTTLSVEMVSLDYASPASDHCSVLAHLSFQRHVPVSKI